MSDQQRCAYRYTVKRGDSFYLIAQRLGVQLRDLLEANPDIPPARLMIGDVLCIPYCNADTPACEQAQCQQGDAACDPQTPEGGDTGGGEYVCPANRRAVVQNGQTAGDLQMRYNLSYHTLQTANRDTDLDAIQGGDVICIPQENIACPVPTTIVLGENDTLHTVAQRYTVTPGALLRANPCLAPDDFRAGAAVRLPD